MKFSDQLRNLAEKAQNDRSHIRTEEAMKTAIVMPLLRILGYDPFNPREIVPEFNADIGKRKGEKVDYAICHQRRPEILLECKAPGISLGDREYGQLYRYYSVSAARFGILTNGYEWRFYADLDAPNRMDPDPFLTFDLTSIDDAAIRHVALFQKSRFSVEEILEEARQKTQADVLFQILAKEIIDPSEELVEMLARRVMKKGEWFTRQRAEEFSKITKNAFGEIIRQLVVQQLPKANPVPDLQREIAEAMADSEAELQTTPEEIEGFNIVRAIASSVISAERVTMRDVRSYCGILIDDNNRQPLARLWFNSPTTKLIGLFDGEQEQRVRVASVSDIHNFADQIRKTAQKYATNDKRLTG